MDLKLGLIFSVLLLGLFGLLFETARKTLEQMPEEDDDDDDDDDICETKETKERMLQQLKQKNIEEKPKTPAIDMPQTVIITHESKEMDAADGKDKSPINHVLVGIIKQALNETEDYSIVMRKMEIKDTIPDAHLPTIQNGYENVAEMDPASINGLLLDLCIHLNGVFRYLQNLQMQTRVTALERKMLEVDILLLHKSTMRQIEVSGERRLFRSDGDVCVEECIKRKKCLQECPEERKMRRLRLPRDVTGSSDDKRKAETPDAQVTATKGPASENLSDVESLNTTVAQSASTSQHTRNMALLILFLAIIGMCLMVMVSELVSSPGNRKSSNISAHPLITSPNTCRSKNHQLQDLEKGTNAYTVNCVYACALCFSYTDYNKCKTFIEKLTKDHLELRLVSPEYCIVRAETDWKVIPLAHKYLVFLDGNSDLAVEGNHQTAKEPMWRKTLEFIVHSRQGEVLVLYFINENDPHESSSEEGHKTTRTMEDSLLSDMYSRGNIIYMHVHRFINKRQLEKLSNVLADVPQQPLRGILVNNTGT